jgi:hypothetical protein
MLISESQYKVTEEGIGIVLYKDTSTVYCRRKKSTPIYTNINKRRGKLSKGMVKMKGYENRQKSTTYIENPARDIRIRI